MLFKKSAKSPKKAFTNEQIRVKAYQIWEKNKEQSEEENWDVAIKALERQRKFRVLISIWRWTGLGEKKGWDILQLGITASIPVILFFGTQYFSTENNKQQEKITDQKQKDELLKSYLNDMKGFLLDKDHPLKKSKEDDESRSIARAVTLTTLTQLNSEKDIQRSENGEYNKRKGLIMQFLFESGLIQKVAPIITLNTADLSFAYLFRANLRFADLSSAYLSGADLLRAKLSGANLSRTYLNGTNLDSANLSGANLSRTNLLRANLYGANLYGANLYGANLYGVQYLTNSQIKMACYWDKAVYTEIEWDNNTSSWTAKDETANQKKIDNIKQDKASDPAKPPDCSMWKQ